ncbi:MAG: metallophosphoesterase, partial [Actinomycetota bacterium]|nr:metallophosphoesterase [Actinomycetota bacterium]
LVLLAGDLTAHGEPHEASVLADACRPLETPVVAVLGNHDWHSDRAADIVGVLTDAGIAVLERSTTIVPIRDVTVGVAGVKGFVGGFASPWANFGERLFREAYAETTADVEALDAGLRAIAACTIKIALLHYAPTSETLVGEPEQLWLVLGTERLARPIDEHRPDLVLHGHAHAGTFAGSIGTVPVYNVAQPVMGQDFSIFELEPAARETPRATVEAKRG